MNEQIKRRLRKTAILAAAGLLIGAGIGFYQIQNETARVVEKPGTIEPMAGGAQVGGAFELVDHNGRAVTETDFGGSYKLIFFGFTYCPAVCPTELQKMTKVLEALGDDMGQIEPLFISVDPERDTPKVMRDYVLQFHPSITGLTGNRAQIDQVLENYKVYATKVESEFMDGYMMDHSAFMYLMSPDDELITIYPTEDTAEKIAKDIENRLKTG